jgi:hypothetical protein
MVRDLEIEIGFIGNDVLLTDSSRHRMAAEFGDENIGKLRNLEFRRKDFRNCFYHDLVCVMARAAFGAWVF